MKKTVFVFSLLLAGCASTTSPRATLQSGIAACMAATSQPKVIAIEVPSANNAISNKLVVATVKMSGSTTVDALVNALTLSSRPPVVVFGENDEVAVATLEAALQKLPSGVAHSEEPLCFAGDPQFGPQLKAAAEAAKIHFLAVQAQK